MIPERKPVEPGTYALIIKDYEYFMERAQVCLRSGPNGELSDFVRVDRLFERDGEQMAECADGMLVGAQPVKRLMRIDHTPEFFIRRINERRYEEALMRIARGDDDAITIANDALEGKLRG